MYSYVTDRNAHVSNIWLEVGLYRAAKSSSLNEIHSTDLEMSTFHALPHPSMHALHTWHDSGNCMILATDMISTRNTFSAWLKLNVESGCCTCTRQSTTFVCM